MKNIYNISKGQLITIWGLGIVFWISSFLLSDSSELLGLFFIILIPFVLIFYTIGWKNKKK